MVDLPARAKLDPVAQRLASSRGAIEWLERQQIRRGMITRAKWCTARGWLLVTLAAFVASILSVRLSMDVQKMSDETGLLVFGETPWRFIFLPAFIVGISVFLVVGGMVGAILGRIPGYRSTRSAIDWSAAADAVNRLISAGYTYPEAYSTAAKVVANSSSRNWLTNTAERVERGEVVRGVSTSSRSDVAMLEALIDPSGENPAQQWELASDHFFRVARGRLTLLTQSMPFISTIIAGFLIWLAISSSLAWFWMAAQQLIGGLT